MKFVMTKELCIPKTHGDIHRELVRGPYIEKSQYEQIGPNNRYRNENYDLYKVKSEELKARGKEILDANMKALKNTKPKLGEVYIMKLEEVEEEEEEEEEYENMESPTLEKKEKKEKKDKKKEEKKDKKKGGKKGDKKSDKSDKKGGKKKKKKAEEEAEPEQELEIQRPSLITIISSDVEPIDYRENGIAIRQRHERYYTDTYDINNKHCYFEPWFRRYIILCRFINAVRRVIYKHRMLQRLEMLKELRRNRFRDEIIEECENNYIKHEHLTYTNVFEKFCQ